MQRQFNIELLDPTKPVEVRPDTLTVYIPDDLPDTDTVTIAVEAVQNDPANRRKVTIYREIDLPKQQLQECFKQVGLRLELDDAKAALLLAQFNYKTKTDA